jgi:hypothetical protein
VCVCVCVRERERVCLLWCGLESLDLGLKGGTRSIPKPLRPPPFLPQYLVCLNTLLQHELMGGKHTHLWCRQANMCKVLIDLWKQFFCDLFYF